MPLTKTNLSDLSSFESNLLSFHQVFICRTYVFLQFCSFWTDIQTKLTNKNLYKVSIGGIRLRLAKLQKLDKKVWKIRVKGLKISYEEVEDVLHYQGLPFMPKVIQTKFISQHYNNSLASHFDINKRREFIGRKYY